VWWQCKADGSLAENAAPVPVHALLLVADDDEEDLRKLVGKAVEEIEETNSINIVLGEWGNVVRNDHNDGIEHFGYADGV
nr:hypothetical protein [Tanacetum cinerariifolium]